MTLHLIDILAEVTESTRIKLGLQSINYMYAPIVEVIEQMAAMTKSSEYAGQKYPFVAIMTDIREFKGERSDMQSRVTIPMVVFACMTDKKSTAGKRYLDSFKPTLQPLYEEWMNQLFRHNDIYTPDANLTRHVKTDRLWWGRSQVWANNGQSVDFIDAIEVNDIEIFVRKRIC